MNIIKIGLIREEKVPSDSRVPLTPTQCKKVMADFPNIKIFVAPSEHRCYKDMEYEAEDIPLKEDLSHCDILMGVKEVPIDKLIPNKTYFFFSHTIKEQPYNRKLLQSMLAKNIRMVDYETLVDDKENRIIGFGRYAGIVGAHNGLRAYGLKTGSFDLLPAYKAHDFAELKKLYKKTDFPAFKVVSTGNGKVARGAIETLEATGIRRVNPDEFLNQTFDEAVFVHLKYADMYRHRDTQVYDRKDFYANPSKYYCEFDGFMQTADLFINGIYWDPDGPVYFSQEDMLSESFTIKVIADVTCDIAPDSSVPSTLRSSKIGDDVYGYDPKSNSEVPKYSPKCIDMMAVDNLPNELPRDASKDFGMMLMDHVLHELVQKESPAIDRGTITLDGELTERFSYLQGYVADV